MVTKTVYRPIFGRGGGGKQPEPSAGRGGQAPVEDANTLQSRSMARFLDLWCEGPIEGLVDADKSIYFDDTPLLNSDGSYNYQGVSWSKRLGLPYPSQTYMPGFPSSENVVSLGGSGVKVTVVSGGIVRTVTNPEANAVIIKLAVPSLTQQDTQNGNLHGATVDFTVYVATDGGAYVDVITSSFSGKCTSSYQRDYRIKLPTSATSNWQIKVVRETADNVDLSIHNDLYWYSYTEVVDSKFSHPNSTYIGMQIDTSQFSGGSPTRSYELKGMQIRIPSNYDPVTRNYTSAWDGSFTTAYSNNPAWCYYDMLTSTRYGLGLPESAVNPWKWDLYTIGQYCDGVDADGFFVGVPDGLGGGGMEPRYQCNMLLNSRQEAYAVINTMSAIFRGMSFWSSGAIRATADMPKSPTKLFTNSNVITGEFKYEGSALKARHTVCKVIWNDPNDGYRPSVEYVDDQESINRYGVRQTDVVAYGATSRSQAIRAGKWLLDTEKTQTETVHFRSGLELADVFPGDVVNIADENYAQAGFSGRATSATLTSIVTDNPFTVLAATTYTLNIMIPTGTLETRVLTNAEGVTSQLTWAEDLPDVPLSGAVYIISSATVVPRQFVILSNIEINPATFEAMALFYDPAKFDRVEQGITVPAPPYNATPTGIISAPSSMTADPRLYISGSSIRAAAIISWEPAADARVYMYQIQAKNSDDSQYNDVGETSLTSIEYRDNIEGLHSFRVRSKALTGKYSGWLELVDVDMTTAVAPSDISGLIEVYDPQGLAFKWTPNTDLNLDHYEVRQGASWNAGTMVSEANESSYYQKNAIAGVQIYWVAAVSAPQGIYSVTPTSIALTVTAAPAPSPAAAFAGTDYALTWTAVNGSFATDHYEIRYGASWAAGTVIGTTKSTIWQAPVNWGGLRTFYVAAIDGAGNVGDAGEVGLFVVSPAVATGLTAQVIDNNVLLRWTAPAAGSVPIDHFLVKKGATYGSAVSIGEKAGTFTFVFEMLAGTYVYWVVAVDSAGNEGTPTSVVAIVAQPPDYLLNQSWTSSFGVTMTGDKLTRTGAGSSWAGFLTPVASPVGRTFKWGIWMKSGTETGNVTLRLRNGAGTEYAATSFALTGSWAYYSVSGTILAGTDLLTYVDPDNNAGTIGATIFVAAPEITEGGGANMLIAANNFADVTYGILALLTYAADAVAGPFDAVLTNLTVSGGVMSGPANATETWQAHFTSNGWSTPQDQITAGYPIYLEPSPATASYVEIFDYGINLDQTLISVTMTKTDVAGTVGSTITTYTSSNGSTWSLLGTGTSQFAANFRFLKVTVDLTSSGGDDICNISSLNVLLSSKLRADSGTCAAVAGDVGGTTATFSIPFISVSSITLTPAGTTSSQAVYDFAGGANPTTFKVLLFDSAGDRKTGTVSWSARGFS